MENNKMSRESKIFSVGTKAEVSGKVKDYESFGWELLSINGLDVSMSRETQNPVYVHLVKKENEYEETIEEIWKHKIELRNLNYNPINPALFIVLTVCLVFPAVLYYLYKKKQKTQYLEDKNRIEIKISELEREYKKIINDSRAIFFSQKS